MLLLLRTYIYLNIVLNKRTRRSPELKGRGMERGRSEIIFLDIQSWSLNTANTISDNNVSKLYGGLLAGRY